MVQADNSTVISNLVSENSLLKLSHEKIIESLGYLANAMEKDNFDREWWAIKTRQLIGNAKNIIK